MAFWGENHLTLPVAKADRNKGYKFETLCLLPNTWDATSREYIENREHEVVSNYQQYCSVVETSAGGSKLVIGGEVDAGMSSLNPLAVTASPYSVNASH